MNLFEETLKELSPLVGLDLHPDQHGACCLLVGDQLEVQIEPDKKEDVVIYAFIGELGPGKFREEVLKEGLKANNQLLPGGTLGYSGKNNQFAICQRLNHETIKGQELLEALATLIDYATQWQSALKEGKLAPSFLSSKPLAPPPFGIKL